MLLLSAYSTFEFIAVYRLGLAGMLSAETLEMREHLSSLPLAKPKWNAWVRFKNLWAAYSWRQTWYY